MDDPSSGTNQGIDPLHFPADRNLELSLLGAVLIDPPVMEKLDFLSPSDFFESVHAEIFAIMREIWDDRILPIDPVMIADRDPRLLSICLAAQIACPTSLYAAHYARKIKELSLKRKFIPVLEVAADMSMNGASFETIREFMLAELDNEERRSPYSGWQPNSAANLIEPPAPREWLLEGMLYRGQITMFFGPPGIRKTLLLMDMCAALCLGQNWLTRASGQPDHETLTTFHTTRPARILWLDYDNGEFETAIRIRAAMTARHGLGEGDFRYLSEAAPWLALDNPSHIRRLIRMAQGMAADVIVIDALGMVLGGVDENAPEVAGVIAKLKEIRAATGAAILVVHHPSKSGSQTANANTYNAAGSAKFSNFFEWTIELRQGEDPDMLIADVVKHRGWAKAKKFAAQFDYQHFGSDQPQLAHELKSFRFYPAALENKEDKRQEALKSAITGALAGGELNQADLIAAAKLEVQAALGSAVGEFTIREMIKTLVANETLQARETGLRRPIFYRLKGAVDPVDPS